jgi:hypothetical protein
MDEMKVFKFVILNYIKEIARNYDRSKQPAWSKNILAIPRTLIDSKTSYPLLIHEMVAAECTRRKVEPKSYRFTRRQVREHTGWSMTQLRVHVERLVDMEYLITHRGGRGQTFVYELLYDGEGQQGEPFVLGLINVDKLKEKAKGHDYDSNLAGSDANLAGQEPDLTGPKRAQNGGCAE